MKVESHMFEICVQSISFRLHAYFVTEIEEREIQSFVKLMNLAFSKPSRVEGCFYKLHQISISGKFHGHGRR